MSNKMQKTVELQTTKVFGKDGELIEASLDDMIKSIKKIVLSKEFNGGVNKTSSKLFGNIQIQNDIHTTVKAYLQSAILCTHELIKRGAVNGGIDTDKYQLLTSTTKCFGTHGTLINQWLKDINEDILQDAQNLTECELDENPEEPFSADQEAKLISEPTSDTDTHEVEIKSKTGISYWFDKIKRKFSCIGIDGRKMTFELAPHGSWRETALAFIGALAIAIKNGVVNSYIWVKEFTSTAINDSINFIKDIPNKISGLSSSIKESWNSELAIWDNNLRIYHKGDYIPCYPNGKDLQRDDIAFIDAVKRVKDAGISISY